MPCAACTAHTDAKPNSDLHRLRTRHRGNVHCLTVKIFRPLLDTK